jgi:hypothetical protein
MRTYKVMWEIDISADSPEEAAKRAREIQLDPESWATVFDVGCWHPRKRVQVDLSKEEK